MPLFRRFAVAGFVAHDLENRFFHLLRRQPRGIDVLRVRRLCQGSFGARAVARGQRYITPKVTALLVDRLTRKNELSPRESEVVRYYALGYRSGQIARALSLSPKTVSTHKARLMQKMGMHSQAELIRYALEHKLLDQPPGSST